MVYLSEMGGKSSKNAWEVNEDPHVSSTQQVDTTIYETTLPWQLPSNMQNGNTFYDEATSLPPPLTNENHEYYNQTDDFRKQNVEGAHDKKRHRKSSKKVAKSHGHGPVTQTDTPPAIIPGVEGEMVQIPRAKVDRNWLMTESTRQKEYELSAGLHIEIYEGVGSFDVRSESNSNHLEPQKDAEGMSRPKSGKSKRSLLYNSFEEIERRGRSNSKGSAPLSDNETRSTHSRSLEPEDSGKKVTGFVQVLPSDPFEGWQRHRSDSNYTGATIGSVEGTQEKQNPWDKLPEIDY